MNTYKIDGVISTGVNLKTAVEKLGFTNINIRPNWRGKSNGEYSVFTSEETIMLAEWVEKKKSLK